jgi:hypothetical protein
MNKLIKSLGCASVVKVSSFAKLSFVIGSHMVWLSGPAIIAPLVGAFGGVFASSIVLLVRIAVHFLLFKTLSLSFLAFCIPGFFGSLYWATRSSIIRVFVPLTCMALFIAHPVGGQAFVYSLYWLIPVALYFFGRNTLFAQALGSTFVAHAVGSVIWLYTVPMTATIWLGLIPVVALERLLFAVCMVVGYNAIVGVKNLAMLRVAKMIKFS